MPHKPAARDHSPQVDIDQLAHKAQEYRDFVANVLQPDLTAAQTHESEVKREIEEYKELREQLVRPDHAANENRMVDLGYGRVYCRAVVDGTDKVFVHAGMGFHIELSVSEALPLVDRRLSFLQDDRLRLRSKAVVKVQSHLQSSRNILAEIERELERDA